METDEKDFEALVRKSGTVFVTNVGNGPEEMVLAIATPTLKKTQVATQADLVAAGYVRVDGLKRAEGERERLKEALATTERHFATHVDESGKKAFELQTEIDALRARVTKLEAAKAAEQEGIAARNANEPASPNPYANADEAPRQAWGHGWKLRDMLLALNERVRGLSDQLRAALDAKKALDEQIRSLQTDKAALQSHLQALQAERQTTLLKLTELDAYAKDREAHAQLLGARAAQHEDAAGVVRGEVARLEAEHTALLERYGMQSGRLQKIQAAYQRLLLEAPHSATCTRVTGAGGCDCWLLKFGYAALEQR
ncbi:MAG: hypothetical protein JWM80_6343 [Cyanobacteria bacterium RYN_339]|nr:hypothetical protein [Cyanobacteria bacterium RYN_339]